MNPSRRPRVKICCIGSVEEAKLAIGFGAAALGLVSEMPSGPGVIPEDLIAHIAASVPPGISTFLLTSKRGAPEIAAQQRRTRVNTLQLVDAVTRDCYKELRDMLPGIGIVQVVHVRGEKSVAEAASVAPYADAILLDSGNPLFPVKELGGTGRTHDWSIDRQIREEIAIPVYVAGGLNAGNVAKVIEYVAPFGVDICSGVRTNGRLDEAKLSTFFGAVNGET